MKARILINRQTGELDGVTVASVDADIDHVQKTDTHDVLDVPLDHPAICAQLEYEAPQRIILGAGWGRELRRKGNKIGATK